MNIAEEVVAIVSNLKGVLMSYPIEAAWQLTLAGGSDKVHIFFLVSVVRASIHSSLLVFAGMACAGFFYRSLLVCLCVCVRERERECTSSFLAPLLFLLFWPQLFRLAYRDGEPMWLAPRDKKLTIVISVKLVDEDDEIIGRSFLQVVSCLFL